MPEKNEYRCTRNRNFDMPGCVGATDITARQGHYVFAESPLAAALEMLADFPGDMLHGFVIQSKDAMLSIGSEEIYTWDVTDGLVAYQEDSNPDWKPFSGHHSQAMIDRGKELVEQGAAEKTLSRLCAARRLLRREDERKQEARKQERIKEERLSAAPDDGYIWMEGVVHSTMTFSKTVRTQIPIEMKLAYDKWPDRPGADALQDICQLAEDEACESLVGRTVGGWMYEEDVEGDVLDFEFEEMKNVG